MTSNAQEKEKLWELLDGFSVAMVVTNDNGTFRARPMAPFINTEQEAIRFLTHRSSHKTDELKADDRACLTFMSVASNDYVSVSGKFKIVDDRASVRELWGPYADTWFEGGPDNENVVVLEFFVEQAEYWDGTLNVLKGAWEVVQSFGNDKTPDIVDHAQVG